MRRRSRFLPVLPGVFVALVLVLGACDRQPELGSGGGRERGTSPPGSALDARSGSLAPDFLLTAYQGEAALGGDEVRISEILAQGKPVVLNFWAGACPPCVKEMPDLQEVYDAYQGEVLLVGLDVGPFVYLGTREEGQALLGDLGVTYPSGTTFDSGIVQAYGLVGMPTTYFIKPDGQIVRQWTGLLTKEKMTELVEELLAKSGAV